MKIYGGLIIGLAVFISTIAAVFGTSLFLIGHQVQNPKTAEYVRQELEKTNLLDILREDSHTGTISGPQPEDEIIIPGIRRGNHLFVEVELNEFHNVRLMVDTGASNLFMKSEVADELNISKAESKEVTSPTANGPTQRFVNNLDTVRIEDTIQHNVRASFGDGLKDNFKDGLLGMSFLKHYYFDIDLEREELHLWPRKG